METRLLVELVAIGIAAVVLLVVLVPPARELLLGSAKVGSCRLSFIMSWGAMAGTLGIERPPPECESDKLTLRMSDLDFAGAKSSLEDVHKYMDPSVVDVGVIRHFYPVGDPRSDYRYAFMEYVAGKMKECGDRVWADWDMLEAFDFAELGKGTICVVCSRIRIDPEVRSKVSGGSSFAPESFFKINRPRFSDKTYYDIFKGRSDFRAFGEYGDAVRSYQFGRNINAIVDDPYEALAVTYVYVPVGAEWAENPYFVTVLPYSKLSTMDLFLDDVETHLGFTAGKEKCSIIVD